MFSLNSLGDGTSGDTSTTCFFNFGKATRDYKNNNNLIIILSNKIKKKILMNTIHILILDTKINSIY